MGNGIAYVLPYGGQPTSDGVTYVPSDATPGCCHTMYSGCCCQCCCCRGRPVSDFVNRAPYPPRQQMYVPQILTAIVTPFTPPAKMNLPGESPRPSKIKTAIAPTRPPVFFDGESPREYIRRTGYRGSGDELNFEPPQNY